MMVVVIIFSSVYKTSIFLTQMQVETHTFCFHLTQTALYGAECSLGKAKKAEIWHVHAREHFSPKNSHITETTGIPSAGCLPNLCAFLSYFNTRILRLLLFL